MHIAGHPYTVLSQAEIELIHRSALRILSDMGMEVQNDDLLHLLAEYGLKVDFQAQKVSFPSKLVEDFIATAGKYDWEEARPYISSTAGVYHCLFHDPASNELVPWTEERLAYYFMLARQLSHVSVACMLGSRLPVPAPLEPLYERYYCWKYGAEEGGSIHLDEICPYLLDLYQVLADERGLSVREVFNGTVYLVPPMKLGQHEAYQVAYFLERGIRVGIGDMYAMGGSAPVTLAGAVTLNLAEQLALRILDWVFNGRKILHIGCSLMAMDMRTSIHPFGRPEMAIANIMSAQLARYYGASFSGHAGLTDSKFPSVESGAQKALTGVPTLLTGGSLWVDAGLLSTDEVVSPIQLILDNELIRAMEHFTHEFQISERTIGLETILEAGPGGHYIDKPHTAQHFRSEHWQPKIWTRQMLRAWMDEGSKLDVDKARELALEVQAQEPEPSHMSESLEREVLLVIEKAREALVESS